MVLLQEVVQWLVGLVAYLFHECTPVVVDSLSFHNFGRLNNVTEPKLSRKVKRHPVNNTKLSSHIVLEMQTLADQSNC